MRNNRLVLCWDKTGTDQNQFVANLDRVRKISAVWPVPFLADRKVSSVPVAISVLIFDSATLQSLEKCQKFPETGDLFYKSANKIW